MFFEKKRTPQWDVTWVDECSVVVVVSNTLPETKIASGKIPDALNVWIIRPHLRGNGLVNIPIHGASGFRLTSEKFFWED